MIRVLILKNLLKNLSCYARIARARIYTHTFVLIIHFMYYKAIITHKQSVLFKNIVYFRINIQNNKS